MTRFTLAVSRLMGIVALLCATASAQAIDTDLLRRKQDDQQRARAMTRELLGGVLELQLRQLEENGLEELPVYRDIRLMRGNLQAVVDGEMSQVVELLAAAQRQPPTEREQSFVEARKRIRTVVVRLSAERQALLRRLKVAELAEQARRLVRLQADVQALVKSIPTEAQSRQDALRVKAREDQADVKGLFFPLLETLDDVRSWGGPMAAVCQDGLRVLQAAEVGKHLDQAEIDVAAAQFASTVEHQDGALQGLRELLKLLEKTEGTAAVESQAALARLRALVEKQEAARQQARQLDPNEPPPTELVEQQAAIQRELGDLERSLPIHPTAERLLEQAESAAKEATADLFDGRRDAAVGKQGQVLGNLAALEEILATGAAASTSDKTAAELAEVAQELTAVRQQLSEASTQQDAAIETAAKDAQSAAPLERAAAEKIAAAAKSPKLSDAIATRVKSAGQAARSAQDALAGTNGPADEHVKKLLDRADDALDRAQSAVEAALNDAQRQAAAVKIGELARAAEALERAAAEERAVATAALDLPGEPDAAAKTAEELSLRQADVAQIASNIAAGLAQTAPQVGQQAADAAAEVERSQAKLAQAAKERDQARTHGQGAARSAQAAAKQLAHAARQLRDDVAETAKTLATHSDENAAALASARQNVEDAMNESIGSLSDRMAKLQAAAVKTHAASREQQRASGRPDAAAAMTLAEQVRQALAAQAAADALPVKAIARQQAVADLVDEARRAAQERPTATSNPTDRMSQALAIAQQNAKAAVKAMLDGQVESANEARRATIAALRQASDSATAEVRQTMQSPPTAALDLPAERAAQSSATDAVPLAATDAPLAAALLRDAAQSANEAVTSLAEQHPQRAAAPQQKTEQSLAAAQQQLDAAQQRLAREQAAMLAQQSRDAAQLADQTAKLDADATAALDTAHEAAAKAGDGDPLLEAMQQALAQSAEKHLERAAATLAAKEQRVRRDQAVAEALTAVAEKQQSAAEILDRLRQMAEAANASETSMPAPDTAEATQATEDFAEAQRATGQGAAEISGQSEVANPMLRAALEMAASLPSARQAQQSAAKSGESGPMSASQTAESPASESTADADEPGELKQAGTQTGGKEPSMPADVGFVPQSPETTAQLMAGPQLTKAIQAALEAAMKAAQQPDPNATQTPGDIPADGNAQTQAAQNDASSKTASATPQGAQPGAEQKNAAKGDATQAPNDKQNPKAFAAGSREGDAEQSLRRLEQEPWFAKLPPELRKSIGAGAQQKAPRAYEERLRRYFQSVD